MSDQSNLNKSVKRSSQSLNRITGNDNKSKSSNLLNKEQSSKNLKLSTEQSQVFKTVGEQSLTQQTPKVPDNLSNLGSQRPDNVSLNKSNLLAETKSVDNLKSAVNPRLNSDADE